VADFLVWRESATTISRLLMNAIGWLVIGAIMMTGQLSGFITIVQASGRARSENLVIHSGKSICVCSSGNSTL
jgi:hypothetical protein